MPFQAVNQYVADNLATDTAALLDQWVANFANAQNYFSPSGYFSEATVQGAMYHCLVQWLGNNGELNNALVLAEPQYPGYANWADLAIIYNAAGVVSTIFIELKADFDASSVDADVNLMDLLAGAIPQPFAEGYVFYVVRNGQTGWTGAITAPTQPDVTLVAINVA
jgi:hypothetical protein